MNTENRIDELIMAGWRVVDSDFDPVAFDHRRLKTFDGLRSMLGPDRVHTKYFENFVKESHRTNILAKGGVIVAAKEQIKGMDFVASELLSEPERIAPNDGKLGHNGGWGVVRTPK
jgi:hypothetical protein